MSLIPNRTKLAAMRFRWRLASRPSATGESAGTWGLLPTQRADFGRCARALLIEMPAGGYVALERLDVYSDGYSVAEIIAFAAPSNFSADSIITIIACFSCVFTVSPLAGGKKKPGAP